MGVINFAGTLPVAVVLQWKGELLTDAVSDTKRDFRYVIANESVSEFDITAVANGVTTHIHRRASRGRRFFDDALNTYTTSPVSGTALDDLIAAGAAAAYTIDLTFTYRTFFDVMLTQMTRTDADLHNLANPNDSQAILDTFVHSRAHGEIRITYHSATESIRALPCTLVDQEVTPRRGRAPAVKLVFELVFTPFDAARREMMRKLIAMDWSKLARFGRPENEAVPFVAAWIQNVQSYLINHTDISRAADMFDSIVARHVGKTSQALSVDLRDDIDHHLITANHWGQAREDLQTERHQRLLSDLFGTLHQSAWFASPVAHLRSIVLLLRPSLETHAQMVLQYGTGHCGEHAIVSFAILAELIDAPDSQVTTAVKGGNANIDHAFVVYDLDVDVVLKTKTTSSANSRVPRVGTPLHVWNLRDAIARTQRTGFVMDPYLDTTVMRSTASELLTALNNRRRRAAGKHTDFLAFDNQHPRVVTLEDITSLSEAERRRRVPNV